jgi:probable rRNA maturation factor
MAGDHTDISPPKRGAAARTCSGSAMSCPFAIHIADPGHQLPAPDADRLRTETLAAITELAHPGEVRVRLVDDETMAAAHLKYSNIPGTTDVLTFDLAEGDSASGAPLDVDILVCVDEAKRQAALRGHTPEREILLYILHGILHCLSYNDHDDAQYERMHAEEDRILTAIGVGPLFLDASGVPGTPTLRGGPLSSSSSGLPAFFNHPPKEPT